MVTLDTFKKIALTLPGSTEEPHFEKTSFRVKGKIFATYDQKANRASIKLSEIDQDVFSSVDNSIIFPVDNKWGRQGWTIIELGKVTKALFADALKAAYREVAPARLVDELANSKPKPGNKTSLRTCKNGHQYAKSSDCLTCPICEKALKPSNGFLSTIAAPARRALESKGITSLEKLAGFTEDEILQLHGIGKTAIPKLRNALQDAGLAFKKHQQSG